MSQKSHFNQRKHKFESKKPPGFQHSKSRWERIFDSPHSVSSWTVSIIAAILIILLSSCVSVWGEVKAEYPDSGAFYILIKSVIESLPSIGVSVGAGILGAAFLNFVYRVYENGKMRLIKSLDYDEMLCDFFATLEILHGKDRRDEEIRSEFHEYTDADGNVIDGLYKLKLNYEYETILRSNNIKFKIDRANKRGQAPLQNC